MRSFSFSTEPFAPDQFRAALADPACGGYASFEGWVRDHNEGRRVLRLEYEAYEALALKEGERIVAEAIARFGVRKGACVHRVGPLAIGELAVWVGVSAAHRDEAFAACRYVIDEVKHRVPIWKKEYYPGGDSGWVNCERCAHAAEASTSFVAHRHDEPEPLELEFESLAAAHAAGFELVDIREHWERDADPPAGRIPNHLPLSEFLNGATGLPAEGRYLIVCAHGMRSLALAEQLRARGLAAVYSMRGGLAGLRT
ncbi:MAG TPA: molybdenum cofactor biosynthesis protein MoaE [Steroidobacteraceae bacterium]